MTLWRCIVAIKRERSGQTLWDGNRFEKSFPSFIEASWGEISQSQPTEKSTRMLSSVLFHKLIWIHHRFVLGLVSSRLHSVLRLVANYYVIHSDKHPIDAAQIRRLNDVGWQEAWLSVRHKRISDSQRRQRWRWLQRAFSCSIKDTSTLKFNKCCEPENPLGLERRRVFYALSTSGHEDLFARANPWAALQDKFRIPSRCRRYNRP